MNPPSDDGPSSGDAGTPRREIFSEREGPIDRDPEARVASGSETRGGGGPDAQTHVGAPQPAASALPPVPPPPPPPPSDEAPRHVPPPVAAPPADVPPPLRANQQPAPVTVIGQIIPVANPAALWGYYLAVFSVIPICGPVLGPAAVVCGVIGRNRVAKTPGLPGTAHAWTAIILGSLTTVGYVGAIVWFVASAR